MPAIYRVAGNKGAEELNLSLRRAAEVLGGKGRGSAIVCIRGCIGSGMNNRCNVKRYLAALERRIKHILYPTVLVLYAYLRLVGIGVVGMHGVSVRVKLQQKGVRHHRPAEKQQQQQGDMSQETEHLLYNFSAKVR